MKTDGFIGEGHRMNIILPTELYDRITSESKRRVTSRASIVREALQKTLTGAKNGL